MKLNEEQYQLIEAYLNNELSETDNATFEAELRQDAEFSKEIEIQREFRLGLRALAIEKKLHQSRERMNESINSNIKVLHKKKSIIKPDHESTRPIFSYWVAAASVILIMSFSVYFFQQKKTSELAYNENYKPDLSDNITKGFSMDTVAISNSKLAENIARYKEGKYSDVIKNLKSLPEEKKTIHYKNYYIGLSYMANNQIKEAIPYLKSALKTPSPTLNHKTSWYLALAYIKNGDKVAALPLLERFAKDDKSVFQNKAIQILKKIQ